MRYKAFSDELFEKVTDYLLKRPASEVYTLLREIQDTTVNVNIKDSQAPAPMKDVTEGDESVPEDAPDNNVGTSNCPD